MTATTPTLLLYSRCPVIVDEETGRRCDHPAVATVPEPDILLPDYDQMRHGVSCRCDRHHVWSVSWGTFASLT